MIIFYKGKSDCVRDTPPSRNQIKNLLLSCLIILICIYLVYANRPSFIFYEAPTVYVIDDFDKTLEGVSHGELIYSLICDNLSDSLAKVYCVHISLGETNNVNEFNHLLLNLLDKNIDIINMSFGIETYNQTTFDLLEQLSERGTIIIAAAGNMGENFCQYPAAYDLDCIISVGAAELNGQIASYSNYGEDVDVFVRTTNNFANLSGTSASCAIFTNSILHEKVPLNRNKLDDYIISSSELMCRGGFQYYFYVP